MNGLVSRPVAGGPMFGGMRAAGVSQIGGPVTVLELPGPRQPEPGEVLLDVQASGAGNWDEFVRTGGWDTGIRPPMALGVEAAGRVAAVGDGVAGIAVGDAVTTHSLLLRGQGSWAQQHLAAAADVALIPPGVPGTPPRPCRCPLEQAGEALAMARRGMHGAAVVIRPAGQAVS